MNVRRVGSLVLLGAASLAALVAAACGSGEPPPIVTEARATPPPTAYIGVIAESPRYVQSVTLTEDAHALVRASNLVTEGTPVPPPPADRGTAGPPRARVSGPRAAIIDRVPVQDRRVALTFDAGADRGYAESILDTLRATEVRASFGMTGQWAEANPDLLRRMVAEGHHLINHTQTHDSFTGFSTGRGPKSSEARIRELDLTELAVQRIANVTTKPYFRPPYGDLDSSVAEDVHAAGYDIVAMWTVDSLGWNGLSRASIEARCLRLAAPGAIYIFHVGAAAQDGPALPAIIDGLRRDGYRMGTLDWLLHP